MTLDDIKRHPHFPFRRFREDDLEFLLLEQYWIALFRDIVGVDGAGRWTPLFPADRQDGNPMLHLADRAASPPRLVRVIQRFNDDALPELDLEAAEELAFADDAYVPFVPDTTRGAMDPDTFGPAEEVVVSSDVSPACERLMRRFLGEWCVRRVAEARMEAMVAEYWSGIRGRLVRLGGDEDGEWADGP